MLYGLKGHLGLTHFVQCTYIIMYYSVYTYYKVVGMFNECQITDELNQKFFAQIIKSYD